MIRLKAAKKQNSTFSALSEFRLVFINCFDELIYKLTVNAKLINHPNCRLIIRIRNFGKFMFHF